MVIHGYLSFLTREANVVYFFREVGGHSLLTKELLRQRTDDYQRWVEAFAANHKIPMPWAEKGLRKEDWVRPLLQAPPPQGRSSSITRTICHRCCCCSWCRSSYRA